MDKLIFKQPKLWINMLITCTVCVLISFVFLGIKRFRQNPILSNDFIEMIRSVDWNNTEQLEEIGYLIYKDYSGMSLEVSKNDESITFYVAKNVASAKESFYDREKSGVKYSKYQISKRKADKIVSPSPSSDKVKVHITYWFYIEETNTEITIQAY